MWHRLWILPPGCDVVLFYRIKFCYSLSILKSVCRLLCVLLQRPIHMWISYNSQNSYNSKISGVFWMVLYCIKHTPAVMLRGESWQPMTEWKKMSTRVRSMISRARENPDFAPCMHIWLAMGGKVGRLVFCSQRVRKKPIVCVCILHIACLMRAIWMQHTHVRALQVAQSYSVSLCSARTRVDPIFAP